jgi:rubrerythrin
MWGKMDKKQVLDVLKESLGMEEQGHKFYKEGSEKIRNSLGKRMLQRLANDELVHISRIKEIYKSLNEENIEEVKIEKAQIADFDDIFTRMKEQLKDASEEMTDVGVDDEEIIDMALELESHAKFFYEDAAKKASDNKVRKFYEMLAQEENSHYELLRNTHNYLENPSLFYGMGYH